MTISIPGVTKASSLDFSFNGGSPNPSELDNELTRTICRKILDNLTILPRFQTPAEISEETKLFLRPDAAIYDLVAPKIMHHDDVHKVFHLLIDTTKIPELYKYLNSHAVKKVEFPESMAEVFYLSLRIFDDRPCQLWFKFQTILGGRRMVDVDAEWMSELTDKIATVFNVG